LSAASAELIFRITNILPTYVESVIDYLGSLSSSNEIADSKVRTLSSKFSK